MSLKNSYIKHFRETWIPNYKRAIFKAKLTNDTKTLIEIQANIWNNWNLTKKEKEKILKELGIWRIN